MSHTPNFNLKIKAILDATQPGERVCSLTGETWMMTEEEISWYKKFNVPPHPWAPLVRLKHLMGFPSGIAIWKKPHADSGKEILSFVHPDSPYQIITDKEWFNREFAQSERELDPLKPFFDQFRELTLSTPVGALRDDGSSVNTVGVDMLDAQDCYMFFGGYGNKRLSYAAITCLSEDSAVLTNAKKANHSFMINASAELHGCRYCVQNGKLIDCTFCFATDNLEHCYGACNQSYKKYLFWNEQLSQGEWEKRTSDIDLRDLRVWEQEVEKYHKMITEEALWPYRFEKQPNEDCTGDYFMECVGCHECYWLDICNDLYRCWMGVEARNSAFALWAGWGDKAYMSVDLATYNDLKFCMRTWSSRGLEYCYDCYDCENCFGCVGLRKKKFHIYNKPYGEEEYWRKLDEIKCAMLLRGEYGHFFPAEFSQPGFQFSMGEFFLGYTNEELKQFNAPTYDPTKGNIEVAEDILKTSDLPMHLDEIDLEKHIGKPILDENLGRMFTITPTEFKMYQKMNVPPPREHFLSRLTYMIRHSNGPIPEMEVCVKCGAPVRTHKNAMFSGRRKVACRSCYLAYLENR